MDFNSAVNFVLQKEGGFSNDPVDRGRATNFGISSRANPDIDVRNLTPDKAKGIYKTRYWDAIGADSLPENLRLVAFDAAVQHGPETAKRMVQQSGGDPAKVVQQRQQLYDNIIAKDPSQARFRNGWNNRLASLGAVSAPAAGTSLSAYEQAGWGKTIAEARGAGFDDAAILRNLEEDQKYLRQQGEVKTTVEQDISRKAAAGADPFQLVSMLRQVPGYDKEIDWAQGQGFTYEQIVKNLAPEAYEAGAAAKQRADDRGIVGRTVDAAGDRLQDIGMAGRQLESRLTGNDAELAQEQATQQQRVGSLDRAARSANWGGTAVDVAASIPLALAGPAGLAGRVALGAAGGAGYGASLPTTGEGQILNNIGTGAALGAGGVAGAAGLSRAMRAAGTNTKNAINYNARDAAARDMERDIVMKNAISRTNVEGAVIDTDFIKRAGPAIDSRLEKSMEGVTRQVDDDFVTRYSELSDNRHLPSAYGPRLEELFSSGRTRQSSPFEKTQAIIRTKPVAGKELDDLRSDIREYLASSDLSKPARRALRQADDFLSKDIDVAFAPAPAQKAQFLKAKSEQDNFKVLEELVLRTNDQPEMLLDPNTWASAQKAGSNRSRFVKGEAPMQDITKALQQAQKSPTATFGPLGRAANATLNVLDVLPVSGALSRALGFKDIVKRLGDPRVRAEFEKLTPVEQAQIMAQARQR